MRKNLIFNSGIHGSIKADGFLNVLFGLSADNVDAIVDFFQRRRYIAVDIFSARLLRKHKVGRLDCAGRSRDCQSGRSRADRQNIFDIHLIIPPYFPGKPQLCRNCFI